MRKTARDFTDLHGLQFTWITIYMDYRRRITGFLCFIILFFPFQLLSQSFKNELSYFYENEKVYFEYEKEFAGTNAEVIQHFLERKFNCSLSLRHSVSSLFAFHYTFEQVINEIPVYGKFVKANVDKNGLLLSISFQLSKQSAYRHHTVYAERPVWFETISGLVPACIFTECAGEYCEEVIKDKYGKVINKMPLTLSKNRTVTDTTVTVKVFIPDPLTSANQNYGAPYSDQGNAEVTELNNQLYPAAVIAGIENDTFRLENSWVKITEHSAPLVIPPLSLFPDFQFTRGQPNFEETNIFYHITEFQLWVQFLGFTNLANYQLHADAHGLNGADNSTFNPSTVPPRITFGDGGVDDGEDADVIIHEYSHAISYSATPGTTVGNERLAIEEGNSDYLAASYSKNIDPYNWQNVYSWDGHNEFWAGRLVQSTKTYPTDVTGNFYQDAEIWSSTLIQIWDDIGREAADKILLQSMYSYTQNMTMPQAAQLYIQADSLVYGGIHYTDICTRFSNRGILNCPLNVSHEQNQEPVVVVSENGFSVSFAVLRNISIQVYELTGKIVDHSSIRSQYADYRPELPTGIYIAEINYNDSVLFVKFVIP